MKVSSNYFTGCETFTVKFTFRDSDNYYKIDCLDFYASHKYSHQAVSDFAKKKLSANYKDLEILSVVYQ